MSHLIASPEEPIFFDAIKKGHVGRLIEFFKTHPDADINARGLQGETGLFWAAQSGDVRMIEECLKLGADPNAVMEDGTTPLLFATQKGHIDIIECLVKNGAELKKTDSVGRNALLIAILCDQPTLAKKLIEMGCPIQADHEPIPNIPLLAAASRGYADVVELMLRNGANPQEKDPNKDWNVLFFAIYNQHLSVTQTLIRMGYPLNYANKNGTTAFTMAARTGNIAIIEALAPHVDVTACDLEGRNALYWAIRHNHYVIQRLIELGCPIKHNALCSAAENENLEAIELLVKNGADVRGTNEKNANVLIYAVHKGNSRIIQRLLELGAPVNHIYVTGVQTSTPLLESAQQGYTQVISILAAAGAEINYRNNSGFNALEVAIENGRSAAAQKLIELGSPLEEVNEETGFTPLLFAIEKGQTQIVEILIAAGAHIRHLSDEDDWNPLCLAVENGHLSTVECLLRLGGPTSQEELDAAFLVASDQGHLEIVKRLASAGANLNCVDEESFSSVTLAARRGFANLVRWFIDTDETNIDWHAFNNDESIPVELKTEARHYHDTRKEEQINALAQVLPVEELPEIISTEFLC